MTKSAIAEWILSQVLPPDRAASTVGDWMEDSPKRGNLWFWSCVFRTAVLRIWSDLTANSGTTARLGLLSYARYSAVILGMAALWNLVLVSLYIHAVYRWPYELAIHLAWFGWAFQTGRWIARRAGGAEVAGCTVVVLLGWAALFAQGLAPFQKNVPGATYIALMGVAHDITLFAGALWLRHRQLHPVG